MLHVSQSRSASLLRSFACQLSRSGERDSFFFFSSLHRSALAWWSQSPLVGPPSLGTTGLRKGGRGGRGVGSSLQKGGPESVCQLQGCHAKHPCQSLERRVWIPRIKEKLCKVVEERTRPLLLQWSWGGLEVCSLVLHKFCAPAEGVWPDPPGDTVGGAAVVQGEGLPSWSHPIPLRPKRGLCSASQH